jgi:acetyl esterase/lipase
MTLKLGTRAFIDTAGELARCADDSLTGPETSSRVRGRGVPVTLIRYGGHVHGFTGFIGAVPDAEVALDANADTVAAHVG